MHLISFHFLISDPMNLITLQLFIRFFQAENKRLCMCVHVCSGKLGVSCCLNTIWTIFHRKTEISFLHQSLYSQIQNPHNRVTVKHFRGKHGSIQQSWQRATLPSRLPYSSPRDCPMHEVKTTHPKLVTSNDNSVSLLSHSLLCPHSQKHLVKKSFQLKHRHCISAS